MGEVLGCHVVAEVGAQLVVVVVMEALDGSLRDELLNEEIFDTLDDVRRKIALWRSDDNAVRPHSSHGNLTPLEARRTLALPESTALGALALKPSVDYQYQIGRLSL